MKHLCIVLIIPTNIKNAKVYLSRLRSTKPTLMYRDRPELQKYVGYILFHSDEIASEPTTPILKIMLLLDVSFSFQFLSILKEVSAISISKYNCLQGK